MGIFDFFKRNKKPKPETGKPSPEQVVFSDTVLEIIGPAVEKFGFLRHRVEIEEYFTRIIFRNGKLYIRINGTTFPTDRKSTRLNSSHSQISYAVFCLKKK